MGYNSAWLGLFLIAGVYFAWRDSMRARELAVSVCRNVCQRHQVQFLDDTVALARIRLCRVRPGGLALHRIYEFEFSAEGASRSTGSISVKSGKVEGVSLPGVTEYLEH